MQGLVECLPSFSETSGSGVSLSPEPQQSARAEGTLLPLRGCPLLHWSHCPIKGKKQSRFPPPLSVPGSASLLTRNGLLNLPGGERLHPETKKRLLGIHSVLHLNCYGSSRGPSVGGLCVDGCRIDNAPRDGPQRLAAASGCLSEDTACQVPFPAPPVHINTHGRRGERKHKPCPLSSSGWLRGQR